MKRPWVAFMLIFASPLLAQTCEPADTFRECWERFNPLPQAEEATEDVTATAATGITNVASPAESSLKDFLSFLDMSLESATTSEEGQAFTFDLNPPIAVTNALGLKLQAAFAETKLNEEVTKRLGENADTLEELNDSLEFGDDTTLSGFVQPRGPTTGRSLASHRKWFRRMLNSLHEEDDALQDEFDRQTIALGFVAETQPINRDPEDLTKELTDPDEIATRIALVEEGAKRAQAERNVTKKFSTAFAKLLNNQPQLYGSVIYHARRNLIGPNEWGGKFTYEFAGNNLNAFRKAHPGCADLEPKDVNNPTAAEKDLAARCATSLQTFADAMHAGIERIAVSIEYHRVNRRWINDPDAGLELGFPRTRSFVGTVAFGTTTAAMLPFRAATTGVGDARLDFTAKYELPEDDESEEKGFVGTLTYTQKVSDTFSLPLSLVYSDHESDLTNVQKKFSARFGLMYKLPDFKGLKP